MNEIMTSLETLTSLQSNKIEDVGFFVFLVLLVTSAVSSYVVSLFYLSFYGGNSTGSQIHRAFPLLRIDRIFGSDKLIPIRSRVIKVPQSDHRMLIADYIFR